MVSRLDARSDSMPSTAGTRLIGNRMVLAGAVMYLMEWVAIIGAHVDAPYPPGTASETVLRGYIGHEDAFGWAAGFWSVVLLGRVLIVIGLNRGLAASRRPHPLSAFAVAAMALSVGIEVVTYSLMAGAAVVANHGGSAEIVQALDSESWALNGLIFGPLGISVLAASWAMLRSGLFSKILCAFGLTGGAMCALFAAAFAGPFAPAADALQAGVPLFWIWMLWSGVVMWRRSPQQTAAT